MLESTPKALIIWNTSKEKRALYRIVAATGASVSFANNLDELEVDADLSLIILDSDSTLCHAERLVEQVKRCKSPPAVLALTSGSNRQQVAELLSQRILTNLFVKNVEMTADELIVTVQKILRNDIFGLEKYLTWGAQVKRFLVKDSNAKHDLMQKLSSDLKDLGCNSRLIELARTASDELIMNAVYNAPVDSNGNPKYATQSRSEPVILEPEEYAEFRYACDGRNLALSVADPFGRLAKDTVLEYLQRCFQAGADQVSQKSGGAGLGLYYIFESLNHFVVNVDPGKRTEMIGLLNVSGSYRDFAERAKSIHLFCLPEVAE